MALKDLSEKELNSEVIKSVKQVNIYLIKRSLKLSLLKPNYKLYYKLSDEKNN